MAPKFNLPVTRWNTRFFFFFFCWGIHFWSDSSAYPEPHYSETNETNTLYNIWFGRNLISQLLIFFCWSEILLSFECLQKLSCGLEVSACIILITWFAALCSASISNALDTWYILVLSIFTWSNKELTCTCCSRFSRSNSEISFYDNLDTFESFWHSVNREKFFAASSCTHFCKMKILICEFTTLFCSSLNSSFLHRPLTYPLP